MPVIVRHTAAAALDAHQLGAGACFRDVNRGWRRYHAPVNTPTHVAVVDDEVDITQPDCMGLDERSVEQIDRDAGVPVYDRLADQAARLARMTLRVSAPRPGMPGPGNEHGVGAVLAKPEVEPAAAPVPSSTTCCRPCS